MRNLFALLTFVLFAACGQYEGPLVEEDQFLDRWWYNTQYQICVEVGSDGIATLVDPEGLAWTADWEAVGPDEIRLLSQKAPVSFGKLWYEPTEDGFYVIFDGSETVKAVRPSMAAFEGEVIEGCW
jgi:hypothetical protein